MKMSEGVLPKQTRCGGLQGVTPWVFALLIYQLLREVKIFQMCLNSLREEGVGAMNEMKAKPARQDESQANGG